MKFACLTIVIMLLLQVQNLKEQEKATKTFPKKHVLDEFPSGFLQTFGSIKFECCGFFYKIFNLVLRVVYLAAAIKKTFSSYT